MTTLPYSDTKVPGLVGRDYWNFSDRCSQILIGGERSCSEACVYSRWGILEVSLPIIGQLRIHSMTSLRVQLIILIQNLRQILEAQKQYERQEYLGKNNSNLVNFYVY